MGACQGRLIVSLHDGMRVSVNRWRNKSGGFPAQGWMAKFVDDRQKQQDPHEFLSLLGYAADNEEGVRFINGFCICAEGS
jgi:hypothetical protein